MIRNQRKTCEEIEPFALSKTVQTSRQTNDLLEVEKSELKLLSSQSKSNKDSLILHFRFELKNGIEATELLGVVSVSVDPIYHQKLNGLVRPKTGRVTKVYLKDCTYFKLFRILTFFSP